MALDKEALAVLAVMDKYFPDGMHGVPIEEARAVNGELAAASPPGPALYKTEDKIVKGSDASIPVRVYWPAQSVDPLPALVWFHGGAFAMGNLDTADSISRNLSMETHAVVVSVDYRLAPEHKFPAGVNDCFDATKWVAENSEHLGIDPKRIAVGGDSAGATLAAVVAQKMRDTGGPAIVFQLLAYPTTLMRVSSFEYADVTPVPASMATHFWRQYVTSDSDLRSPYCGPMNASDLSDLPPALVIIPEVDSTRADQEMYAQKLAAAGVMTSYKVYPGMPHGFLTMGAVLEKSRAAVSDAARALRSAFA